MSDNPMDRSTWIYYSGKHNKHDRKILVAAFSGLIDFAIRDRYVHSTHATQFHGKIKHDLPDGEYVVNVRQWLHHQADCSSITLQIFITDIE
jgi:hypothetical protein